MRRQSQRRRISSALSAVPWRPRAEAGNALTVWVGEFSDYKDFGGALVPERGAVRWEAPEGPFTYWRGTITSLETRA